MFKRLIIKDLQEWKDSASRKPLVLRGARQVGKTVAIRLFGAHYKSFSELNLEEPNDAALFKRNLSPREIVQAVRLRDGIPMGEESWLLFLDEIQFCPEAVAQLRYFYEQMPAIHIVAAGSLLEIALQRKHLSFPVGRVEFRYLYPMCFEEFLCATANEQLVNIFKEVPSPAYAFDQLMECYHRYALIGGMPEAVARYAETNDVVGVNSIYENLFSAYIDDISKYARNDSMSHVLKHCLRTAPLSAGSRIHFAGFGASSYGSRESGEALRTLEQVMLVALLYPTTAMQIPYLSNLRKSPRLQFIDTGLMNYLAGIQQDMIGIQDLSDMFRGRCIEQLTGQELMARFSHKRFKPLFWVRNKPQSQAEIDFLDLKGSMPVPIEVKSGAVGKLRSLHLFMKMQTNVKTAIRLYRGIFEDQSIKRDNLEYRLFNVPYYHASKVQEYMNL